MTCKKIARYFLVASAALIFVVAEACKSAPPQRAPLLYTGDALVKPNTVIDVTQNTNKIVDSKEESISSLRKDPPSLQKEGRKKKGRFNFSSDEFVKETAFNPFENKKDTVIRLRGHARVSASRVTMSSPQIEIFGDNGHLAYAHGPVEIVDSKNATRLMANEALFIRAENRALVRGDARLVSYVTDKKKKKTQLKLTSSEIDRAFDTSISRARGNVIATGANAVLYANSAEFHEEKELVVSDDKPRIVSSSDIFLANRIEWNVKKDSAHFVGNVRAYFSRVEEGDEKRRVDSALHADEGDLVKDEKLPHGQKLTLRKNVSLERLEYSASSDWAEIFGQGAELVKAYENVVLVNKTENTRSFGDQFEWIKESGALALSAKKNRRTRTLFYNEKSVETAEVSASTLTRASEDAYTQARGSVTLIQFSADKTSPPVTMGSEWAEIRRDKKIIVMNGSPYVEGEMGRIGAREIILHYEEERYEMLGILPGIVEKTLSGQN